MKRLLLALILSAAAIGPAAVTATANAEPNTAGGSTGRSCFNEREIRAFTAAGDHAVNLRIGGKDVYHLELMGRCENIGWARWVHLKAHGSGGGFICDGQGVDLITQDDVCPVRSIRKLTPEEVAALPSKERP
jgi:hypothetical protein